MKDDFLKYFNIYQREQTYFREIEEVGQSDFAQAYFRKKLDLNLKRLNTTVNNPTENTNRNN